MNITYANTTSLINSVKTIKAYKSDDTTLTFYHGCTDYFLEVSFTEYNFSYIVDKLNLSEKFKSYYFDNTLRANIGKDINDVDLLNKTLMPTIISTDVSNSFEYFGSIEISGGYIYLVSIPEDYSTVDIFDTIDGTDYNIRIVFTDNESSFKKLVYIYISSKGEVSINLSYKSWYIDKNRNRNQNSYLLRNDYYRDTNPIKKLENSNFYIDERSGTLIGEVETVNLPIYTRKKNIIDSWTYTYNNKNEKMYSPYKVYKRDDKVSFYKVIYRSLCDNNINNNPALTKEWEIYYEN